MTTKLHSPFKRLYSRLYKAREVLHQAEIAERRAGRVVENAEDKVWQIQVEIDEAKVIAWGDNPDLSELLVYRYVSTIPLHLAFESLLVKTGFSYRGKWEDTNQYALCFGISPQERDGVTRVQNGILFFAPALKVNEPKKEGWVKFGIMQRAGKPVEYELRYSKKRGTAQIRKTVNAKPSDETMNFQTLHEALTYVQVVLWMKDAPGSQMAPVPDPGIYH